ncbi:PREDICTED: programmed cell death protein 5 [Rhagoletis zephyria]|uniref:programmed cell death protein 5 n=1 Tax=Rhagoletis zephyria TaxID=28612 RepID=UPI0008116C80|nr:PREDICTED: programmed cell death protein 5 [Rhagoletis zephyria]XP_036336720.1 programmed cell death protein 5 [Rhagoletis pomonella]XP_036336721.1 programmed cell death protein 5 [Rhagoletis pomonella]
MADNDLDALRAERLAQLQQQYGGSGGNNAEKQQAQQEQMRQQEEMKHSILSQVLDQQARARLNTLKISKPEKAQMFENMVIRMAQMGQVRGKLDDTQFKSILESINAQMPQSKSTVKYDRRRAAIDSDDDDDYGC